jgi:hypothetical protein
MNLILSSGFVTLFAIDYYLMYSNTVKRYPDLTVKRRAHILSIKASLTLFLVSLYFNYKYVTSNFDKDIYLGKINGGTDAFVLQLSVLNLMAYFITDCIVGYNKYHQYMCNLTGYFHHIVYIIVSVISFRINATGLYVLYLIEELPTIFLNTGRYNHLLRKDYTFGLTFFLTRIVYHIFLTWKFKSNFMFIIMGALSLSVHCYWFRNWCSKYIFNKQKSQIEKNKIKKI